jgi:integrase/recombinase XerD
MAKRLANLLRRQRADHNYMKKVFEHIRAELGFKGRLPRQRKLPELLTEDELTHFYEAVWNAADRTHMVMIKLLLYTGIRNAELASIQLKDVDLKDLKVRIEQGKGRKDRYVPLPPSFRGEMTQYVATQREREAHYLFETRLFDKFTTRWIGEIIKRYARKAGIEKRIYPHLFRHQLLTFLTKKGLLDSKIQLISGHQSRQSLAVYQTMSLADVESEYQAAMREFPIR